MWNDTSKFDMASHAAGVGHRDRVADVEGAIAHLYGDTYPYEWDGVEALGGAWRNTKTGETIAAIEHVGLSNWPDAGQRLLPKRDADQLPREYWARRWSCSECGAVVWAAEMPAACRH